MSKLKKQTYLEGAMILVLANAVVKVIGALFKIPLANILGEEGMAIFSTAYNLYACLFVIATAGLPVAVSKMVSESIARKNYEETGRIFKAAVTLLGIIGIIGAMVLFFGAKLFANVAVKSPQSYLSILAVSPAIFFVSVLSAFRGYFQGMSNMIPTAFSEVIEAAGKMLIGLVLSYLLMPTGIVNAASGAVLGVTAGTFFACIMMIGAYIKNRGKMIETNIPSAEKPRSIRKIFVLLLKIAVPITIGAAVSSLTNVIDMVMIRQRLQTIMVTPEISKMLTEYYGLDGANAAIGKLMQIKPSEILYGAYSGFAIPLFNLPPTIVTALSMSVVPAISGAFALKNYKESKLLTESTIRITTLFSVPCAVGLSVLSAPVLLVVYNNIRSQHLLAILAFAVIFVCIVSVTTAILQATGNVMMPVYNMLAGGIVKIATNYFFIAHDTLNIGGAPLSTLICYLTIATLNIICIKKVVKPHLSVVDFILKPALSAVIMGAGAYLSYTIAAKVIGAPTFEITSLFRLMEQTAPITPVAGNLRIKTAIALCVGIFVAIIIYMLLIFLLRAIKKEDILMLPKGEKIAKMLTKCKLIS